MLTGNFMTNEKPNGRQKRQFYIVAFCLALAIDMLTSFLHDIPYRPTLVGLAVMIAAVLYFAVSLIRER
jgi:hypothetical protein